jgi:hypothetical protein
VSLAIAPTPERGLELALEALGGRVLVDHAVVSAIDADAILVARPQRGDSAEIADCESRRSRLNESTGDPAWSRSPPSSERRRVVGGLTMYARFKAAHVPAIHCVAVLPRGVLVAEGLAMRCVGEIDITRPRRSERPTTLVPVILGNIKNFEPGAGERRFEQGRQEASNKEQELLGRLRR